MRPPIFWGRDMMGPHLCAVAAVILGTVVTPPAINGSGGAAYPSPIATGTRADARDLRLPERGQADLPAMTIRLRSRLLLERSERGA